jgi:Zn ribbon nucleic-acid-binding protein
MGKIERWSFEQKAKRRDEIGDYIPCPICKKLDGLSTWEGERYMVCQHCGAKFQKKQFYRKPKLESNNGKVQQKVSGKSTGKT